MTAGTELPTGPGRWPIGTVRGWKLWKVPRRALLLILGIEAIAALVFVNSLTDFHPTVTSAVRWALLAGLSVLHAETAARAERMRRYLTNSAHVNTAHVTMISVWALAAVLCLPTAYAATLVGFLFAFNSWQRRNQKTTVAHREIYNAANAMLAALAASAANSELLHHLPAARGSADAAVAAVAALIVYFGVNVGLLLSTIYFAVGPVPVRELLPDREEVALEFGTLVLGILTAETVVQQPWLTPLVLIVMVLLQRSSLVTQLELAAATDAKTGLLNAAAWQELAQRELVRAQHDKTPCAVLLLDLDHFKRVNDTLGHLAGDSALRAIGDALKRELRGYDAVARFGGEEFVMFLHQVAPAEAMDVAERTLARIRGLVIANQETGGERITLTASIGLASYPQHGIDLTDLMEAADGALYGAKRAGRDQVGLPPSASVFNSG